MPFNKGMKNVKKAIQEVIDEIGMVLYIADEEVVADDITSEIKRKIEEAEFVIFDLTDANPNVFYELGYAEGVGNEGEDLFLIAKEGTEIPFNISTKRIHFYKDAFDLRGILKNKFIKLIKRSRN
jgi:hypothetical protein